VVFALQAVLLVPVFLVQLEPELALWVQLMWTRQELAGALHERVLVQLSAEVSYWLGIVISLFR
jgi:hypothetical protein